MSQLRGAHVRGGWITMARENGVATVGWLVTGKYSDETIITAPDAPADAATSVERLDLALHGFTRPLPAWYRVIGSTGYWWYLICMIVGVAVVLLVGTAPTGGQIAAGMGAGLLLALPSGWLLGAAARRADRRKSGTTPEKVARKLKSVAQKITDGQDVADIVLDRAPQREAEVHDLLWRSTTRSDAVLNEIEALIAQVAPALAAERKAAADDFVKQMDDAKRQGKF